MGVSPYGFEKLLIKLLRPLSKYIVKIKNIVVYDLSWNVKVVFVVKDKKSNVANYVN